jgi:hypothetical protein
MEAAAPEGAAAEAVEIAETVEAAAAVEGAAAPPMDEASRPSGGSSIFENTQSARSGSWASAVSELTGGFSERSASAGLPSSGLSEAGADEGSADVGTAPSTPLRSASSSIALPPRIYAELSAA